LRNRYSGCLYLSTLEEGLIKRYTGEVFIQDNAPIYTSHLVCDQLLY